MADNNEDALQLIGGAEAAEALNNVAESLINLAQANDRAKESVRGLNSELKAQEKLTKKGGASERGVKSTGEKADTKRKKEEEKAQKGEQSRKKKQRSDFKKGISGGASLAGSIKGGKVSSIATTALELSELSPAMLKATGAISALITVLGTLAKASASARKSSTAYAQSLRVAGQALSATEQRSLDMTNNLNKLSNQFGNLFNTVGDALNVLVAPLLQLLDAVAGEAGEEDTREKRGQVKGATTSSALQSGFSLESAGALASGTYSLAQGLSETFGEKAYEIAGKLSDAWLTGSDAAKQYGVVLNDTVLAGYMASKGIDIVNVEITDAMRQYYRYQLLTEELNTSNKSALQQQIKQWTQLGIVIDKTKGKLFSFDEVINLDAFDTAIPEVPEMGADVPSGAIEEPEATPETTGSVIQGLIDSLNNLNNTFNTSIANQNTDALQEQLKAEQLIEAGRLQVEGAQGQQLAAQTALEAASLNQQGAASITQEIQNLQSTVAGTSQVATNIFNGVNAISTEAARAADNLSTTSTKAAEGIASAFLSGVESLGSTVSSITQTLQKFSGQILSGLESTGQKIGQSITQNGQSQNARLDTTGRTWYEKLQQIASGISSSSSSGSGRSQGAILSPLDIITEGSDIVSSIKDDKGKYQWGQLPSAAGGFIANSITSPFKAFGSGFGASRDAGGSFAKSVGAGLANTAGYVALEGIGDAFSMGEVAQDFFGGNLNVFNKNTIPGKIEQGLKVLTNPAGAGFAMLESRGSNLFSSLSDSTDSVLSDVLSGSIAEQTFRSRGGRGGKFADGGIGTQEIHNATLFEDDKKEAVIPLESQEGVDFLAQAMQRAQGTGGGAGGGGDIIVNLSLDGLNIAENEESWQRVGNKLAEIIDIQRQRRGELNYGSGY